MSDPLAVIELLAATDWLPPDLTPLTVGVLCSAAFLAGFVDAIVGGGGLIQLPAMFAVFPTAAPALLLGTNKVASVFGTATAAIHYARRTPIEWNAALPATAAALVFAFVGAFAVSRVPGERLRDALPVILLCVAAYVFFRPDLGTHHRPALRGRRERAMGAGVGVSVGFYDGLFGPGTGSFLVFLFVRVFGYSFLSASAAAKVVNVACNLAAIAFFALIGTIWLGLALPMAACNVLGSTLGARVAIARGSGFVRALFLIVVGLLVFKTTWDAFRR